MPSLDRVNILARRSDSLCRMAGVALAIRLYDLDNNRRPASLNELVGKYLSEIPVDFFDPNDSPIRYLPDADSPVIYSVNVDGKDDGGRAAVRDGRVQYDDLDLAFFLSGDRPRPASKSGNEKTGQVSE